MESNSALRRALKAGESVILTTGATAIVRKSYPAGYVGDVEILLDGAAEKERVSGLTLTEEQPSLSATELSSMKAAPEVEPAEARAPSRRMKD